jgi:hypothetical protein
MPKLLRSPIVVLIAIWAGFAALMSLDRLGDQVMRGVVSATVISLSVAVVVKMARRKRIEPTMPNAIRHWTQDDRNARNH